MAYAAAAANFIAALAMALVLKGGLPIPGNPAADRIAFDPRAAFPKRSLLLQVAETTVCLGVPSFREAPGSRPPLESLGRLVARGTPGKKAFGRAIGNNDPP
jgi:hypothetical protein